MKIKNFGDFVNEKYNFILEGKEHKFADKVYKKIADGLSELYDISDNFYGKILDLAIKYYDKKKDKATIDDFMSVQKDKLDALIEAEKKRSEKAKKKDEKNSKGKDFEKDDIEDEDEDEEDDETIIIKEAVFTDANFEAEVLKADMPSMIHFWAPWCESCIALGPTVDALAKEYEGRVNVGKVNVDENKNISIQYGITSIPCVMFFKDGKMVDKQKGAASKSVFDKKIKQLL